MNPFVIELTRRKKEVLRYGLLLVAVYLFGLALELVACTVTGEMESIPVGTMFALIIGMILQGFGTVIQFSGDFNLAVSMGETRRRYVWCYQGVSLLKFFGMALLLWLMWQSEQFLYGLVLPEVTLVFSFHALFQWKWMFLAICALLAFEIFLSACILRFSTKAMWAIWLTWLLFAVGMSRNPELFTGTVGKWFLPLIEAVGTNSFATVCIGIFLAAVFEMVSWLMLRKQRVTV